MKRLVWLLLAVFVTALAQVSPVDLGSQHAKACSCCEPSSTCGNRDCGTPPAVSTRGNLLAEQPGQSASTAKHKKAARIYRLAINYLFQPHEFSSLRNFRAAYPVSTGHVPLFKTQCSFLI